MSEPEPILTPEILAHVRDWEDEPCACGHIRAMHLDRIGDPTCCGRCFCDAFTVPK